jgi:hypothetical protein
LYVWSGNLRGVKTYATSASDAVDQAVRANLPCVVGSVLRVSLNPKGPHPLDVYYEAPYEEQFPELFQGDLDVQVAAVEKEER